MNESPRDVLPTCPDRAHVIVLPGGPGGAAAARGWGHGPGARAATARSLRVLGAAGGNGWIRAKVATVFVRRDA